MTLKQKTPMKRTPMSRTSTLQAKPAKEAKPAKGPREKKCANRACRAPYLPDAKLPWKNWCGDDCALVIALDKLAKQKAAKQRKERADDKAKRETMKKKGDYVQEAQRSFNRYIRLRALRFGHVCISSGEPLRAGRVGGGFDCGHFRSVGSAPHLRFDMRNAWGQTKKDNRYGAGMHDAYRRGLVMRKGLEFVERLEADQTQRRFTVDYLIRLRKIFDRKAARMQRRIEQMGIA